MATLTERRAALSDILKSQSEGGAAMAGGSLGAGADVPAVLDASPATRQLTEEAIATRTGRDTTPPTPESPSVIQPSGRTAFEERELQRNAEGQAQQERAAEFAQRRAAGAEQRSAEPALTAAQIRQDAQDILQAQINKIEELFSHRFQAAEKAGIRREGQSRGLSAASGTTYGAFGAQRLGETQAVNEAQVEGIRRELAVEIANAIAESKGETTKAVQDFEQLAAERADAALGRDLQRMQLEETRRSNEALDAYRRGTALGQFGEDPTLEAREFLQGQQEFDAEFNQRIEEFEASGWQLESRYDGSVVGWNPVTDEVRTVITADEALQASRGREGSTSGSFSSRAAEMRKELLQQDPAIGFSDAFNSLRVAFPDVLDSEIDAALGGRNVYDPTTGTFTGETAGTATRSGGGDIGGELTEAEKRAAGII